VQKRGSKWSAVLWDRAAKKKVWQTLPASIRSKRDAEAAMRQMQDAIDRQAAGLPNAQRSAPAWDLIAGEILGEIKIRNGKAWHQPCKAFVGRFLSYTGICPAEGVTAQTCREYAMARQQDGANPYTLRKELSFLKRVFARAVDDGWIAENPWKGVTLPREPKEPPRFLSRDEADDLLAVAPPERRFRYLFLIATGARKSEALRVTWEDIDIDNATLRIRNAAKGGGPRYPVRVVPLSGAILDALRVRQSAPKATVLEHPNNWPRDLAKDVKAANAARAVKRLPEIEHVRIHDLRHTFGSWLAQAGISLHRIRDLMGHASVTTTEQYAHLQPLDDHAAAAVFAELGSNRVARASVVDLA
jgi:integrase